MSQVKTNNWDKKKEKESVRINESFYSFHCQEKVTRLPLENTKNVVLRVLGTTTKLTFTSDSQF